MGNAHWIIAPNILNQTTVGYNKTDGPATHVFPNKNWNDLGVPITLDQYNQFYIQFQSISSMNTGDTNNFIRDEAQVGNTTRWTKGRHNLTFGGEYHRARGDIVNNFRAQGRFYFTKTAGYTGYDVADFLIGRWAEFIQGAGEFKNTRFQLVNLFFNDSFKINRRLTAGLRRAMGTLPAEYGSLRQSRFLGRVERPLYAVCERSARNSLRGRSGGPRRRLSHDLDQLRSPARPCVGHHGRRQDRAARRIRHLLRPHQHLADQQRGGRSAVRNRGGCLRRAD